MPAGVISKFGEASPDRLLEGVAKGGVGDDTRSVAIGEGVCTVGVLGRGETGTCPVSAPISGAVAC
ncbi:MAG: hypothetical protein ACJ8CB_24930, partial [Ktedonobacteraceae bacterium]